MKKIKTNVLKTFLFVCLGLIVTVAFAAVYDTPGPPGRPEAYDIYASGCKLKYLPPKNDGGLPIIGYLIERRYIGETRWVILDLELNKGLTYTVHNMMPGAQAEFRVSAENAYGRGPTSKVANTITFDDPLR